MLLNYIFLLLILALFAYFKWSFVYWAKRGVVTLPPSIPAGNAASLLKNTASFGEFFKNQYNYFKLQGLRFGGCYIFTSTFFIPVDPTLIKSIMQTDFRCFPNHGTYTNAETDPLSGHLFGLEDLKWKRLREKLTPTFTSGKIKTMFPIFRECARQLQEVFGQHADGNEAVDIKDVLGCFTTDIIMSCAFGIESNCLKNPDSELYKYAKMIFEMDLLEKGKRFLEFLLPRSVLTTLNFKTVPQSLEDFIMNLVRKTVEYRERNNVYRKDFMHLLIQLKNMGKVTDDSRIKDESFGEVGLRMEEIAAQVFIFFAGGFETSSTTMMFALYELAINGDVQAKLRHEIRYVTEKHGGELSYDALMEMKYLDCVIQEALRKYPPVPTTFRKSINDYKIPDSDVIIPKDTFVMIPILGLHRDADIFPMPEKFDPERFNEENRKTIQQFTFLPFGEGPRICIGARFGMLQAKVGLASILSKFRISINKRTQVPITFNKSEFILNSAQTIWLDVNKI